LGSASKAKNCHYEVIKMLCEIDANSTLLLKHLSERYSTFLLTAMVAFVGTIFFLPLALLSAPLPSSISPMGIGAVVYLGILVTVGAYGLYNFSVSRMPASQASGFSNLIPVFTLLFAILLLGERLNAMQMLAAVLVFAGVLLSQWRGTRVVPAGVLD
jgi:drug/metabolite transporter (DMT)-like permease